LKRISSDFLSWGDFNNEALITGTIRENEKLTSTLHRKSNTSAFSDLYYIYCNPIHLHQVSDFNYHLHNRLITIQLIFHFDYSIPHHKQYTTMDSMRSLNTSLPGTSPPKQQVGDPPEALLSAFKAAALSVTKLYKTAATDQGRARSEGYQDALDELLAFLDKEDIGLSDGEGWRIRRWATERLDGRESVPQNVESDDEVTEKADRASSPILQRSQSATRFPPTPRTTRTASPAQTESSAPAPNIPPPIEESTANLIPPQSTFTFRSSYTYPQDADIILSDLDSSDTSRTQSHDASVVSHASNPTPGIAVTRPTRTNGRHNNHTRLNPRGGNTIGRGAGQKRKINFGEFFDIGNLGHGKEGFGGGGKRGRFA
jgi:hypothetical protein